MIQVFNPATGAMQKIAFKDLLTSRGTEVKLAVGDIVYVPRSGLASVGFFLQQIAPVASLAAIGTLAAH